MKKREEFKYEIQTARNVTEPLLPCPKCHKAFSKQSVSNTQFECLVDICYSCNMVWYDQSELEELFRPLPKPDSFVFPDEAKILSKQISELGDNSRFQIAETEDEKKKALIRAIHQNSGLTAQDKGKIVDFIVYGPPKQKKGKDRSSDGSWLDIFDSDGGDGDSGGDGDGD
ncbi:MAG: hypothetical protein KF713_00005 [Turneriella sp.]|nr:hypothetical protein [Turneriella sp.]